MEFNIQKLDSCTGHKGSVFALCAGLDADTFYSSGEDGTVAQWSVQFPDLGKPIAQMAHSVYALHLIPELKLLVVAQNTSGLHFIHLETFLEVHRIAIPSVSFFDIKHVENTLFAADSSGTIHRVNLRDFSLEISLRMSEKSARTMAINIETRQLAIGFSDHKIRVVDFDNFKLLRTIEAHSNSVFSIYFTKKELISVSRDAKIKAWDIKNNFQNILEVPAHLYAINQIIKIDNLPLFVTCSMDKSIKVWQEGSFKLLKVINKAKNAGHGTSINKLLWLPENEILLSASDDRTISIWKLF
jgi:WD40 repeat protein